MPHVIPRVRLAGGQTWGENRVLGSYATGEGCFCSIYPRSISPAKKAVGECTCEGETCRDLRLRGLSYRCHQLLHWAPARALLRHPPSGAPPLQGPSLNEQQTQTLFWNLNLMLFFPCLHPGGTVWALPSPLLCSGLPLGSASLCFSFGTGSDCKGPPGRWEGGVEGNSPAAWGQAGEPSASRCAGSPGYGQGKLPQLQPSLELVRRLIKCLEILLDERHYINVSVNLSYTRKHLSRH